MKQSQQLSLKQRQQLGKVYISINNINTIGKKNKKLSLKQQQQIKNYNKYK